MKSKSIKILIGFKWQKTEDGIFKELKSRGYNYESFLRFNKTSIRETAEKSDVDVIILKEYLDGGGKWSAKELSELADDTGANIVVVCSRAHKGRDFIKELYAAGITSAVFSDGKFGVKPSVLTDLALNKRGKREARAYYGLKDTIINHGVLCYEDYMNYLRFLMDKTMGLNIVDRFVTLANWIYPKQMAAFIDGMPDEMLQILTQYKEFYKIYNKLLRMGYVKLKIKAPKSLKVGIPKDKLKEKYVLDTSGVKEEKEVELTPVDILRDEAIKGKLEDDASYEEEFEDDEDADGDDIYAEARREREKARRKAVSKERRERREEEKRLKKDMKKKKGVVEIEMEEQVLPEEEPEAVEDEVVAVMEETAEPMEKAAGAEDVSLDDEISKWL